MKKWKRGRGFTAYTVEEPETLDELLEGLRRLRGLDLRLVDLSEEYRSLLAQAGVSGTLEDQRQAIIEKYGEESLPDLFADYIIHAEIMRAERTKLETEGGNAGGLIVAAAWCGQLRERIFWKYGIDDETKMTIEDLAIKGRRFKPKKTDLATKAHPRKSDKRATHIISTAKKILGQGYARFKNGKINQSDLAQSILKVIGPDIGKERVRQILRKAIRDGKLA